LRRAARGPEQKVTILTMLLNPTDECRLFCLPPPASRARILLNSATGLPDKGVAEGKNVMVEAHSVLLLHSECDRVLNE
jgi:hypothetical protein